MTETTRMTQPFRLPTAAGRHVDGLIDLPREPGERPAIVLCHGFKGFMEWGFFPHLAELLSERGFVTVRFNLSGSGMEPGQDRATDLAGFTANTCSRELEDLDAVLSAVAGEHPQPLAAGRIDRGRIGLLGHSRGGGAAVLTAARQEWRERLSALVTWASVATFDRFSDQDKETWRRQGTLPVVNARTGQELALGLGLLKDLETHRHALDVERAASEVGPPWLIVHGGADESVPVEEARRLAARAEEGGVEHRLAVIEGAGHTFGATHPFEHPTPHLTEAMNLTQTWFRRHVRGE
jgi:uncharacterized protein